MQTQVQDIPNFTHNNDIKNADLYIFDGDVSLSHQIVKVLQACITHLHSNDITDKYPKQNHYRVI
jgi:hypothetical protein